jgi:hexosaminidase
MRPFRLLSAALLFALGAGEPAWAATDPADTHPDLHLIPWPKSLHRGDGHLRLTAESRVVATDNRLKPLTDVLADDIALVTGLRLQVVDGPARAGDIVLQLDPLLRADEPILVVRDRELVRTKEGAHSITIGDRAVVSGFDYRSTAEGTATILQLLGTADGSVRLPKVTVRDWPHADYCGVMLDVARQDHSIDDIKKVVQLCRMYKARYLQLHLTDDQGWTFPSTKYPSLGSKNFGAHGGVAPRVYKLDELKALVAFADNRGVTLVPELEMPGHAGAALRSVPEVFDAINPQSKQPVGLGCMNMSNEDIYPALDAIIGEMCAVFRSSPYFHIGSDEVTSGRLSLHPGYKEFLTRHGLKDEHQLADHFIAAACDLVKKHGKKAIKWEGLANTATKDVIVMCWEGNSTTAADLLAKGYTTITCPWGLGVPWDQWDMYLCNASRLKRGDSVLGATLVAWEQPPRTHIANLRKLASRQERTWGPDNRVTEAGFAARFQPLDAVAGKLIDLPPKPQYEATATTTVGTSDFLDPVLAFDGNDATFYQSAKPPKTGDHFTLTFPEARSVHTVEVLTGMNHRGLLAGGEVQVSLDGMTFTTVATLDRGEAKAVLKDNRVRAVRIRAASDQAEPLIVRAINLRLLVEIAGVVRNPATAMGDGNVAAMTGDVEFVYPIGTVATPVINQGFTLRLNNGGNPATWSGPISGTGKVEISAGGPDAPLVLDGKAANSFAGIWSVKTGRVMLGKEPGVDAMAGTIIVGGTSDRDGLVWNARDQLNDGATVELLGSPKGGASLDLNGFSDTFRGLKLAAGTTVRTDGPRGAGVLTVRELTVDGKRLPRGTYTSSIGWLRGRGYVIVGDVKRVNVSGVVEDPNRIVGAGNMAVLTAPTTFKLPNGECSVAVVTGDFPLALAPIGETARFAGFVTGNGPVRVEASADQPLTIGGPASSSYLGPTTLARGVLRLGKPAVAVAIPNDLVLGGSAAANQDDRVIWEADAQIAPSAVVTLQGDRPSHLDLNGYTTAFAKLLLSKAATVQTGDGGTLRVKQLFVDGRRLADGTYRAPQSWLTGSGTVTVDARVDVHGVIGSPETAIGTGNVGNLTGDTTIGYPAAGGDFDIRTNGHNLRLDSGDGNAFAYSGSISGTGSVEFHMGPSYTGFRDAPMLLTGPKPNTATGKFLVKKGRVQLEKPEGVAAISGDVVVGGQGFNDCLFWKHSHQLKDTVNITLLDAGNSGAAYLHLNGCQETAASLTLTSNNKVLTDSASGTAGELTVRSLTVAGLTKPAGTYRAATEKWIEGKGAVIVRP